jgi:hypothetical protein
MRRIVSALAAAAALGALAYAGPARACGAQQKTTMAKADEQPAKPDEQQKAQQQASAPVAKEQASKDAKAQQQQQTTSGAQAKADTATARPEQK